MTSKQTAIKSRYSKKQMKTYTVPFLRKLADKEPKHPGGTYEDRFKNYIKNR